MVALFLAALNCISGGRAIDKTIPSDEFASQSVTLLAVRPHPDDASTSTGGMLAYYRARDGRTVVVICTGGEEGEIHDPDLDPVADKSSPLLEGRSALVLVRNAEGLAGLAEFPKSPPSSQKHLRPLPHPSRGHPVQPNTRL